jgi:hypothetical protein
MRNHASRLRIALAAVLSVVLVIAVTALAAPPPGKGNQNGEKHGNKNGKSDKSTPTTSAAPSAGAAQYGPGGKQYGKHRVTICHKGHTIKVAQPAVKAHLRHGDKLGPC